MQQSTGVLVVSFLLAACGGTSSPGESSGGGGSLGGIFDDEDPMSPPAQGAVIFQVKPASPQPTGLSCPTSGFTAAIPDTTMMPAEALSDRQYQHKIIDGEDGAAFSCRVATGNAWTFAGEIRLASRGIAISEGTLTAEREGTATIRITDSLQLGGSLTSSEPCVVRAAAAGGNNLQIKPGSMWASFACAAVEAPPSSSCAASGYFVLENCVQE